MTTGDRWIAATWPLVRSHLPASPAHVVEVGCGSLGGFVPMLDVHGYVAVGIDPVAPDGAHYQQMEFERAELPRHLDAVVACTSLHHIADPATVIDRIVSTLSSRGTVVVIEWAWEEFDTQTAEWCFSRLSDGEEGWLRRHRDEWRASGKDWRSYLHDWAEREGLHRGDVLVRLLDQRLERKLLRYGPYFFPDLADTSEADEQSAIAVGQIRATRIHWVGTRR